jgi:hypothetical protein
MGSNNEIKVYCGILSILGMANIFMSYTFHAYCKTCYVEILIPI